MQLFRGLLIEKNHRPYLQDTFQRQVIIIRETHNIIPVSFTIIKFSRFEIIYNRIRTGDLSPVIGPFINCHAVIRIIHYIKVPLIFLLRFIAMRFKPYRFVFNIKPDLFYRNSQRLIHPDAFCYGLLETFLSDRFLDFLLYRIIDYLVYILLFQ